MGSIMNKWKMRKILNYVNVDDRVNIFFKENEGIFVFGD